MADYTYPFVFAARANLTSSTATGTVSANVMDTDALNSPLRHPVLIDEIRFLISPAEDLGSVSARLAGYIDFKLRLGRFDLTSTYMPIWLFGAAPKSGYESEYTSLQYTGESARWVLPHPLYVPPGGSIIPSLRMRTIPTGVLANASTVRVTAAFVGRSLPVGARVPKVAKIPYVSSFVSDASSAYAKSGDMDLINPFDKPMRLQRLTGRIFDDANGREVEGDSSLTLKIEDSTGYSIVREHTPFYDVFDINTRAWTTDRLIGAKERLHVTLLNKTTNYVAQVGMIGWREEEVG